MSRVRRLVSDDVTRHGVDDSSVAVAPMIVLAEDASDPLALLGLAGGDAAEIEPDGDSGPNRPEAAEGEPEAVQEVPTLVDSVTRAEPMLPPATPVQIEDVRPEMLDVIASLAPVLRAVQIFPGPTASPPELVGSIRMLSQDVVRLADMLSRETDACEVDVAWRRRRTGILVSELVASHWVSTIIRQQGVAAADMWPTEGFGRVATAFCAAVDMAHESETLRSAPIDLHAIVLALAPVHIDLQRTAEHLKRVSPEAEIDIDAAALAIATTASEEVAQGAERLMGLMPVGSSWTTLAAELMAAVGPMAQAAWDSARGEMYALLKAVEHDQEATEQLIQTRLQGGLPVKETCERLRVMVRRLVSMSLYTVQAVSGGQQ